MHDFGVAMMRENLRRQNPDESNEEINRRLRNWLHSLPLPIAEPWLCLAEGWTLS